ncbi:hypothetical protein VR41_01430 [Streptomyces sp. NRRL B-1568]|nr:hypothetical protein VR41_01430 [Streptomyces sp. NRRL B-1568]
MDDKAESEAKPKGKRLELSIAQVAGSALAAVIAALLAGKLGVYGTVIGAGVVSVVATTGGTVFQHLFRRTGEQLREATVTSEPRLRRVPVRDAGRAVQRAARSEDPTTALPAADDDRTQLMPQAFHPDGRIAPPEAYAGAYTGAHRNAHLDGEGDGGSGDAGFSEEYTRGTTHGTRLRGWKRPLLAAGAVFVLAMGTVTAVELVSGSSADGSNGTTVSRLFQPEKQEKKQDPEPERQPGPGHSQDGSQGTGEGGTSPSPGASPDGSGGTGKQSPGPSASPSGGGTKPSPNPSTGPTQTPGTGKGGDDKGGAAGGTGTGSPSPQPPQGQNAAAGTGTGTVS